MASSATRLRLDPLNVPQCEDRKLRYPTKDAAWTAAEAQMDRGEVNPGCHITPYLCEKCGSWHTGNRVIVRVGRHKRPYDANYEKGTEA